MWSTHVFRLGKFTTKNSACLNGNDLEMSSAGKSAGEGLDAHEPYFNWDHLATYVLLSIFGLIPIQLLWPILHYNKKGTGDTQR